MEKDYSTFLQAGPAGGRLRWQGRRIWHRSRGGTRGLPFSMSMNLIIRAYFLYGIGTIYSITKEPLMSSY